MERIDQRPDFDFFHDHADNTTAVPGLQYFQEFLQTTPVPKIDHPLLPPWNNQVLDPATHVPITFSEKVGLVNRMRRSLTRKADSVAFGWPAQKLALEHDWKTLRGREIYNFKSR